MRSYCYQGMNKKEQKGHEDMADYINMQETEYDELQEKIALIHDVIE